MALHDIVYYAITLIAVLAFTRGVILQLRMERAAQAGMFDAFDALFDDWNRIEVATPVEPTAVAVSEPGFDKSR